MTLRTTLPKTLTNKNWLVIIALCFAIVLIAHYSAITAASGKFGLSNSNRATPFTTRMIEPWPTVSAPIPTPSTPVKPPQTPSKKPRPQTKNNFTVKPKSGATSPVIISDSIAPELAPSPMDSSIGTLSTDTFAAPEVEPDIRAESSSMAIKNETTNAPEFMPAPAFTAPPTGKQNYAVTFTKNGNPNSGKARLEWQHDGTQYKINLTASYFGISMFEQTSVGQMSPQGLLPSRFGDKRAGKSEVAAHLNHDAGVIIFSANTAQAPLLAGAQDRVSLIVQIAGLLAADPARYTPSTSFHMQTVSANLAEPWLFTVNELESITLPTGQEIFALHVTRNPRREYDQKVELWFAPDRSYTPIRFRFTETNGDYVDALISEAGLP